VAKLGWIGLNWWIGWWRGLRGAAATGVLLFDRYYGDLLVDPLRYRYGGPAWIAAWWSRLLPRPDRVLYLDAREDVLLERKREVSREALTRSRIRYRELVEGLPGGRIVDASRSVNEVVQTVRCLIDECE
jgi:thymidylate kinase